MSRNAQINSAIVYAENYYNSLLSKHCNTEKRQTYNRNTKLVFSSKHPAVHSKSKENQPVNAVSCDVETLGEQMPETRCVQHRARCNDSMLRQTAEFPRDPGHDVTWVGDDDNDGIRAVPDQFGDDALEDSNVLLHKVKTCLTFLLTSSSCYDDHARIL